MGQETGFVCFCLRQLPNELRGFLAPRQSQLPPPREERAGTEENKERRSCGPTREGTELKTVVFKALLTIQNDCQL